MPREFGRNARVASQLQRELADLLRDTVADPRLGMVTVSEVEVTRDLSVAKIYVSFLGAEQSPQDSLKLLAARIPMLRHEVGRRVRMRTLPDLRFVYDDSIERGLHMDAVLESLPKDGPTDT